VAQFQQLAERAVLTQVGASLLAQENLLANVRDFTQKYGTRSGMERELKRYERRGSTARNRVEREVRRTRTQIEREWRQRRDELQRSVRTSRNRLEREVRSVRKDLEKQSGLVTARVERMVANAQGLMG
jgi:hypothetical protein